MPSPGELPNPGTGPGSLDLEVDSLVSEPAGKPRFSLVIYFIDNINSVCT